MSLWVENELEQKEGWFKATISVHAKNSLTFCPQNPDGYTIMEITELISENVKFLLKMGRKKK